MQKLKVNARILILLVLAGFLSLSSALSQLMNSVVVNSTGRISIPNITAESGYWRDIQEAVNWIIAHGGIGNVYIPEGDWNFVDVGESWTGGRVRVPAGVSIFGAPTDRTSGLPYDGVGQNPNDQVVEWKTILRIPWDAPLQGSFPEGVCFFWFYGTGDPNKLSRVSNIKFVGYRSINSSSIYTPAGITFEGVMNFRVDHCYFENIAGGGVGTQATMGNWLNRGGVSSCGVIDHCYFVNTAGDPQAFTVRYGVSVNRGYGYSYGDKIFWDPTEEVLGKYTDYSVYIEDCYFEKWRHCVAANDGGHYVIRHCTIANDYGYGSLDAHGGFETRCTNPSHGTIDNPTAVWNDTLQNWVCSHCGSELGGEYFQIRRVGTRAVEIYNCKIVNATNYAPWATFIRGGAGVAFNNTVGGGNYGSFIYLTNDVGANRPEGAFTRIWDWWIWNNTMLDGCQEIIEYDPENDITEGINYYRHAPHTFNYTPYPYPHPLTLQI